MSDPAHVDARQARKLPDLDDNPLLHIRDVARLFEVTEYTVRKWLRDPEVPLQGMKVGNRWRVRYKALVNFANSKYGADIS